MSSLRLIQLRSFSCHLNGLLDVDLPLDKEALDWNTRMKIAAGAAKGLEYLHDKANPPVIYRDFKSSNILLDEGFHPKLSDFGLAKLGPVGDKSHVSTRVMGTYGYCAPEYAMTGQLTVKSDVYSFGVVLLELITGRRAIDSTRPHGEQNLVSWVSTALFICKCTTCTYFLISFVSWYLFAYHILTAVWMLVKRVLLETLNCQSNMILNRFHE